VAHCIQAARSSRLSVEPTVLAVVQDLLVDIEAGLAAQDLLASVRIVPVAPGASRADCLRAAVRELEATSPATTKVLVHDLRRPLASADLCARVAEALATHDAVIPALTMVDSVKAVDSCGSVRATVDRSVLRSAQFPRGFGLELLRQALAEPEVDEIQYVVSKGLPLELVAGDPDAFLIDRSRDASLAEAILACRLAGHR
jgi:2-C-methyl-D-erythritol 4-phosphate cytidylyltransferase